MSGEVGKSIIFAVSQDHAGKIAQILNLMADKMFPGLYQSDFAVQVTSQVDGAQQHTINFTNNNLLGSANFIPTYKTSKARVHNQTICQPQRDQARRYWGRGRRLVDETPTLLEGWQFSGSVKKSGSVRMSGHGVEKLK